VSLLDRRPIRRLMTSTRRRKIGEDPNNTTWANDTEAYGHKMLLSQGWTPGGVLGAKNAAHSSHYTAANSSHIRVLLKDDNLGLGAQRGKAEGQNFGLLGFNDLLGRLNGKEEAVIQQEQQKRLEIGKMLYAQQRWGGTNFVSGGLLVGDRMESGKTLDQLAGKTVLSAKIDATTPAPVDKKDAELAQTFVEEAKQELTKSKSKETRSAGNKKERRAKDKISSKRKSATADNGADGETSRESKEERRERRAERRARKEEKRQKKEAKAALKTAVAAVPARVVPPIGLSVRQRYIKQKRMASMDPQALREVC